MIALALLLAAAPPAPPSAAPRTAQPLGFADFLYASGDYYRAIGEYERYLFENPGGAESRRAQIRIGLAYLNGGRPAQAADYFEGLADASRDASLRLRAGFEAAVARYRQGENAVAAAAFERVLAPAPLKAPALIRSRAAYLLGWAYLLGRQPARAAAAFRALAQDPLFGAEARRLEGEAARADRLPHRSPVVAGLLSAAVPGAGYFYLGQPGIALAAAAWNGLFGFGVYDAARHQIWGLTAVVAVFTAMWYGGAIFGSVSGAHKFNRDAWSNYVDDLKSRYDWTGEEAPAEP